MANDLSRNPWILDTASATPVKGGRVFTTGFVFQDYSGGTGSQAIVTAKYKNGRRNVFNMFGIASGSPVGEGWLVPQNLEDIELTQIDSGVVKVIVR
jgi:hypothetical protein